MRKPRILFLCTGNSCRSQMAEGWARHLLGDSIQVYSAGTSPKALDARAVQVMAEAGVDISHQRSKPLEELKHIPFDYVITVCDDAYETCPIFFGNARVIHRGFADPPRLAQSAQSEEEAMNHYRRVRDEIRRFVQDLPQILRCRPTES